MKPPAASPGGSPPSPGTPLAQPERTTANGAKESLPGDTGEGTEQHGTGDGVPRRWTLWLWVVWVVLVAVLVTADQATKAAAETRLDGSLSRTVIFIPGILSFTYRENPGGPFSLLAQSRFAWVLGPLAVAATAAIIWWLLRSQMRSRLEGAACALIVGGAVGNLIDRLHVGAVRDFLKLTCIRWPVFNLADAFVSVGVGLLLLAIAWGGASPCWGKRAVDRGHLAEARSRPRPPSPGGSCDQARPG